MRTCTTTPPRPRGGFTLIELLVVIAIIAILAALSLAILGRVIYGGQEKATNQTLQKLSSILNQQWKAVIDQAKDEYKTIGGVNPGFAAMTQTWNPDTARSLWIQLRLRQEFPTSFAEATSWTTYNGANILPPKRYYVTNLQSASSTGMAATYQSSACLYLALAPGRRGMVGSLEDSVGTSSIRNLNGATVIVDLWNTPIAYVRGNEGNVTANPPNPAQFPVIISAGANTVYESGGGDDLTSVVVNVGTAKGD
jgi:prepilin-type N-terminal cleavage/methylation domain-containing protein